ncbi:MAG: arylsulfatase [Bacteroidales bacterium]|nr:arylsulfatase [Bacteroidales bacterium]
MKKLPVLFLLTPIIWHPTQKLFAQDEKPNVIVIMTDDQGNNLGIKGNPWLKTPEIDKFANDAVSLTNFHQATMCTPSRAALMTGKYPLRTGAWRTSVGRSHMPTEEITIAEVFNENGYKTGQFGKWHLGDVWPFRPADQGFDEVVRFGTGGISQVSDYWGNDYFDDTYYHNGVPTKYEGYCTDVFFNETIRYIKECKANKDPFMIYLAPNIAHLPAIVSEEYSKPFEEKGHVKKQAIYYGMITNLDENMGRLMTTLEQEGLSNNTIVVFTTDDGTAGYAAQFDEEHRALETGFNMGQRGGKGSPYEGGHRLFSYIRWPEGGLKGGKEVDALTSVMDIFPTLVELCEIKSSEKLDQDGISFKPALYGKEIPGNESRVIYLSKIVPDTELDFQRNMYSVIEGEWRWINRKELYNIKEDLDQRNNIAADNPGIVSKMEKGLDEFLAKNASKREVPVRFLLGDKKHKTISLTTQDLWGKPAFSQGHVRKLSQGSGPWKVTFLNDGKYKITLSRYPLYTGFAFNEKTNGNNSQEFTADKAKLAIGTETYEKGISATDKHVSFEIEVKAGDNDLETWIYSEEGITIPSYFVEVEYID